MSIRRTALFASFLMILPSAAMAKAKVQADLVVTDARIVTGDPAKPEASAIALKGDEILAVGTDAEVAALAGPKTRHIDADGKLILPGFIEAHAHLRGIGEERLQLDFKTTTDPKQIVAMVAETTKKREAGAWIMGRGWDQNDWSVKEFPTSATLNAVAPEHPVYLERIDGHAAWVNAKALAFAGVTGDTPDPEGGRIHRDAAGEPTGILLDTAMKLVEDKIPRTTSAERKRAIRAALQELARYGVTSFHDAGAPAEDIKIYKELLASGELTTRLYVLLDGNDKALLDAYFAKGPKLLGKDTLTIRSIKLYADGALGSRGAALLEPYADEPQNSGVVIDDEEKIYRIAKTALEKGFQVGTHAIGDRGNRLVLNAYERAFKDNPAAAKDARFRIEHAQILDEADIPRFAALGVIASMQATHATSDMPWAAARLGEGRAKEGAYVWQKLLKSGARFANGSDAPVESANPLWGLYAAVTRQDHQGQPAGGWMPEERLSIDQAIESFTKGAAYAGFAESKTGTLAKGRKADLVMLSQDVTKIAPKEILATKAVLTIMGGRVTYQDALISLNPKADKKR